jgi:hypothetical protein
MCGIAASYEKVAERLEKAAVGNEAQSPQLRSCLISVAVTARQGFRRETLRPLSISTP